MYLHCAWSGRNSENRNLGTPTGSQGSWFWRFDRKTHGGGLSTNVSLEAQVAPCLRFHMPTYNILYQEYTDVHMEWPPSKISSCPDPKPQTLTPDPKTRSHKPRAPRPTPKPQSPPLTPNLKPHTPNSKPKTPRSNLQAPHPEP